MTDWSTQRARRALSDHEQMLDAQSQCVPCKLCGGEAVISDAGRGAGYYIACKNAYTFRPSSGCLITERRLGGWAYNVMDWWNRLHSPDATLTTEAYARGCADQHERTKATAVKVAQSMVALTSIHAAYTIAAAIEKMERPKP